MTTVNPRFGERVRELRLRPRGPQTQRALAQDAGIKVANLSGMERGVRPCGPDVASRLASVLGLRGTALLDFMQLAATTTERGHLWVRSPNYEQLLAAIADKLRRRGVDERGLVSVSSVPSANRDGSADILAVMQDGSRAYIQLNVRIERGSRR